MLYELKVSLGYFQLPSRERMGKEPGRFCGEDGFCGKENWNIS